MRQRGPPLRAAGPPRNENGLRPGGRGDREPDRRREHVHVAQRAGRVVGDRLAEAVLRVAAGQGRVHQAERPAPHRGPGQVHRDVPRARCTVERLMRNLSLARACLRRPKRTTVPCPTAAVIQPDGRIGRPPSQEHGDARNETGQHMSLAGAIAAALARCDIVFLLPLSKPRLS